MTRVQTMVQLSGELLDQLDQESRRTGDSRSAIIREAVTAYLAGSQGAGLDRLLVAGYTRVPQATPDAWGDLSSEADFAAGQTAARLNVEESAGWS